MADEYIKCSTCKCKYNNTDDDIKKNFGYDRLNKRYKCCVKCKNRKQQYQHDNYDTIKEKKHQYWIDNKDKINEKREILKKKQLKVMEQYYIV